MQRTQMYLTEQEVARLDELAAERGTTRSDLVRQALAMAYGPMITREERLAALHEAAGSVSGEAADELEATVRAIHDAGAAKLRRLHGLEAETIDDDPADRG